MKSTKLSFLNPKPQTKSAVKVSTNIRKTKAAIKSKVAKAQPANPLLRSMAEASIQTTTENGAVTYSTSLSKLVDFFAMGKALRSRTPAQKYTLFKAAFAEDRLLALKALFNVRDVRGGGGERQTFRDILSQLAVEHPALVIKNLSNIAKYGRWDDVLGLVQIPAVSAQVVAFIKAQIEEDLANFDQDKSISLLAKWLPSINGSWKEGRQQARFLAQAWSLNERQYRKLLSALRSHIDIVESKMCADEWATINYEAVPSQANKLYRNAFKKHDAARYNQFISAVEKGEKKINASTLYPYELYEQAQHGNDATVEVLWKNLPDYLQGNKRNILVVADVSESMSGRPMATSVSLAIYTAERNEGAFKDYFITFTDEPTLQSIAGKSLSEKIRSVRRHCGYDTNLQKVFTNLLRHAVQAKVKPCDMPRQIIVISDMEFNNTAIKGITNFQAIKEQYKNAGYSVPNLVFWNVASRQDNLPAKADEKGVLLVSGASPSVFDSLLSGKTVTPIDQMVKTLNSERYSTVIL
jgi:Domain of unknown function (DUF2828)